LIRALSQVLSYLRLYFRYTRWRLPVLFLLIAAGGLVEAIGVVAVLPLLSVTIGPAAESPLSQKIVQFLGAVGIAPTLGNLLLIIVAAFLVRGAVVFSYIYFSARIMVDVGRELQTTLTRRFCDMQYTYYTQKTAGWFNNLIVGEVSRFVSSLRNFTRLSVSGINTLVLLPIVLALRLEMTLAIFAVGGVALWSLRGLIRKTAHLSHGQTRNAGQLNSEFIQLIQSFIYLKATNSMAAASSHVLDTIERFRNNDLRLRRTAALFEAVKEPIAVVVLAGFIFYEVGIRGGSMPEVIVVALLLYRVLIQLVSFGPQIQAFNEMIGGVSIVQDVTNDLDRHVERLGGQKVDTLKAPIVFRDVGFNYGNTTILDNVNVVVNPNETVGVVGASGAGKTTFFHLLTGLLEPKRGSIAIGTHSYGQIDKGSLRARIGYVTQDPIIFNDTVANNISLWQYDGKDQASLDRIQRAARIAKCEDFIDAMSKGYDSPLGDRGINLSGGQRQRIAIAREIYKDPELLIFDEAASALDADSERYVQESIDRMHGERTVVVITHRLASVRHCDRIYVFDDGEVIQSGTFAELYAAEGSWFRRMCEQQGVSG
jgi:ABC-type multidrug transport system fused ATPase/permease subunit